MEPQYIVKLPGNADLADSDEPDAREHHPISSVWIATVLTPPIIQRMIGGKTVQATLEPDAIVLTPPGEVVDTIGAIAAHVLERHACSQEKSPPAPACFCHHRNSGKRMNFSAIP
jgi:hypothetical protein